MVEYYLLVYILLLQLYIVGVNGGGIQKKYQILVCGVRILLLDGQGEKTSPWFQAFFLSPFFFLNKKISTYIYKNINSNWGKSIAFKFTILIHVSITHGRKIGLVSCQSRKVTRKFGKRISTCYLNAFFSTFGTWWKRCC